MLRLALSLSLASLAAAGINLDDHFSRSTKLQSPSQLDSQGEPLCHSIVNEK